MIALTLPADHPKMAAIRAERIAADKLAAERAAQIEPGLPLYAYNNDVCAVGRKGVLAACESHSAATAVVLAYGRAA